MGWLILGKGGGGVGMLTFHLIIDFRLREIFFLKNFESGEGYIEPRLTPFAAPAFKLMVVLVLTEISVYV